MNHWESKGENRNINSPNEKKTDSGGGAEVLEIDHWDKRLPVSTSVREWMSSCSSQSDPSCDEENSVDVDGVIVQKYSRRMIRLRNIVANQLTFEEKQEIWTKKLNVSSF